LPATQVTVAVPTLTADSHLRRVVEALLSQTLPDSDIAVIDNSGRQLARRRLEGIADPRLRFLENARNLGFGAAVNQAWRSSDSPYVAAINDDALPSPRWLAELVSAMETHPRAGMCASRVILPDGALDSAGMRIGGDGSSRQRGHLETPRAFDEPAEVLLPSGSAALYRRAMLDELGGFDDDFFLYCEDTDLGLRGRWLGWECRYVPSAVVEHHYSATAGRVSPLKAYYIERNRMFVALKNFPLRLLWRAPFITMTRYAWHALAAVKGRGAAGQYRNAGHGSLSLVTTVARAHAACLGSAVTLWRKRREVRRAARIPASEFTRLLRRHWISAREVAEL